MHLYRSYLKTLFPNREIYWDSKSFIIYEFDGDDMLIHDVYSESIKQYINILRFVDFKKPENLFCQVMIGTENTENNISKFSKQGFKIYRTTQLFICMKVDFETWQRKTKKFFMPTEKSVKVEGLN